MLLWRQKEHSRSYRPRGKFFPRLRQGKHTMIGGIYSEGESTTLLLAHHSHPGGRLHSEPGSVPDAESHVSI
ncbi:hypothetical protein ACSBR1_016416 [Camellia fascicularis]